MRSLQVSLVQPHFNRLTVFDGRYPHGVRPVEGTRDPLKARLVLHGWFTEPTPFFDGGHLCTGQNIAVPEWNFPAGASLFCTEFAGSVESCSLS